MSRREAHIFLWHGSKSSEDSRATAKAAAKKMQERFVCRSHVSNLTAFDTRSFLTDAVSCHGRQL